MHFLKVIGSGIYWMSILLLQDLDQKDCLTNPRHPSGQADSTHSMPAVVNSKGSPIHRHDLRGNGSPADRTACPPAIEFGSPLVLSHAKSLCRSCRTYATKSVRPARISGKLIAHGPRTSASPGRTRAHHHQERHPGSCGRFKQIISCESKNIQPCFVMARLRRKTCVAGCQP